MNGIYFDLTADALAIVASDGHKLVRRLFKESKMYKCIDSVENTHKYNRSYEIKI